MGKRIALFITALISVVVLLSFALSIQKITVQELLDATLVFMTIDVYFATKEIEE